MLYVAPFVVSFCCDIAKGEDMSGFRHKPRDWQLCTKSLTRHERIESMERAGAGRTK